MKFFFSFFFFFFWIALGLERTIYNLRIYDFTTTLRKLQVIIYFNLYYDDPLTLFLNINI